MRGNELNRKVIAKHQQLGPMLYTLCFDTFGPIFLIQVLYFPFSVQAPYFLCRPHFSHVQLRSHISHFCSIFRIFSVGPIFHIQFTHPGNNPATTQPPQPVWLNHSHRLVTLQAPYFSFRSRSSHFQCRPHISYFGSIFLIFSLGPIFHIQFRPHTFKCEIWYLKCQDNL